MRGWTLLAASALIAGCASTELRYAPSGPVRGPSFARLAPIASFAFKDSSGGLRSDGTGLTLSRPFFDAFRDAVWTQLGALKIATTPGLGAAVEIELTGAFVQPGAGAKAGPTAAVKYRLTARRGDGTACRQDAAGSAAAKEGPASSSAAEALRRALARAMDGLEPAIETSCLYAPAGGLPVAASAPPRDPKTWALIAAVGRYRDGSAAVAGAPQDALAAAEFARAALSVPDDHVIVAVDNLATLADLQKYTGRWLADRVGPDGKVFLAFFGRGAAGAARGAVLLPFDGDADYPAETGLSLARLYADLGRLRGRAEVVLGRGVAARPSALPANVRLFAADADPRAAFQAAQVDWRSR